jgi:hypothetical protein
METILSANFDKSPAVPLALRERTRLASILSRLASPYDNERATAGLLASAFVSKHDLLWSDLTMFLRPLPQPTVETGGTKPQQDRRRGSRKDWLGYCRRRRRVAGQILNLFT